MCQILWTVFLLNFVSLLQISKSNVSQSPSPSRILFLNGFVSRSVLHAQEPLALALADRGHAVTILSAIPQNNSHPNITDYCPEAVLKFQASAGEDAGTIVVLDRLKSRYNDLIINSNFWDKFFDICSSFYSSLEFRNWVEGQKFDLVFIDVTNRECALPLAYKWGAKTILFSTAPIFYGDFDTFGLPLEVSHTFSMDNVPRIIPESLYSDWTNIKWYLWRQWDFLPRFDALVKEYLNGQSKGMAGVQFPSVAQLEQEISLYFLNTYFSSEMARSLPPFVQQVGGMHCKKEAGKNRIADKEIREFIEDKNSNGFILISFGSFFKISALPEENLKIFFDTISRFPQIKFLWKWEGEERKNLPKNLFLGSWFPQQDLLAHKKCKGFVSQAGLMSYQQAVFHAVPLILIPFTYDQIFNARSASKMGFGIHLELAELTLEDFSGAIEKLIPENNRYKTKVAEMSRIERDRPMPAVDLAVYWTEYVLRHDNVDHLKSPGVNQFWWERRLIHIYFIIFAFILLAVFSFLRILSFVFKSREGGQQRAENFKTK